MKKMCRIFTCATIALSMLLAMVGCSEAGYTQNNAMATAIGLGHHNCITEATVIVDGAGGVKKVQFDEIFPVADVMKNIVLSPSADTIEYIIDNEPVKHFKYLNIGDKYFQADAKNAGIYAEIGGATSDLVEFCKTNDGVKWYYDNFMLGKMFVCKIDSAGEAVGNVKLKKDKPFNTLNGSMRKRYSKYWNTQGGLSGSNLGFNGNMDMLENYLITYGFEGCENIKKPSENGTKYNTINGISTGATLSGDTAIYINVAKKAYDKAINSAK